MKARTEMDQTDEGPGTGYPALSGSRNQPDMMPSRPEGGGVSLQSWNQPDTESNRQAADGDVSQKSQNQPDGESNRLAADSDVGL
jgi:hypothetical protein